MSASASMDDSFAVGAVISPQQQGSSTRARDLGSETSRSSTASAEPDAVATPWSLNKQRRKLELLRPNFLVRWAFYFSIFAIPFARLYVPGSGDRLGVKRVIQALMIAAMLSRPRVCLRFAPVALLWFAAYACVRLVAGLWLAPE